jgi:hypothetical protein
MPRGPRHGRRGPVLRLASSLRRRLRHRRRGTFFRLVPKGSVCAEIGVWKGDFTARIVRAVEPTKLHLIDPWAFMGDEAYRRAWYGSKHAHDQAAMDRLYGDVLQRFAGPIAAGVVEVHRCPSAEAACAFTDGYFDWVYIDGNHLYSFVRQDLELFDPKVKDGGLIAGDDYGVTGWWKDGVTRAVDEFVTSRGYDVVSLEANQFVLRKPGAIS